MRLESHEYTTIKRFFEICKDEELKEQTQKALKEFKGHNQDNDDENYVLLSVEGYYVIAERINLWAEKTHIDSIVLPYTKDRIYPIQQIKKKITFI